MPTSEQSSEGEIAMEVKTEMKQVGIVAMVLAVCFLVVCQSVALAQNLGAAPQVNVAVQGQTGAQPEGAFLNFVNWIGNVIAPVGAGVAVLGAVGSYASGRGVFRWLVTAAGLLAISGLTRFARPGWHRTASRRNHVVLYRRRRLFEMDVLGHRHDHPSPGSWMVCIL